MSSEQTFRFQKKVLAYIRRRKGKLVTLVKIHDAMKFRVAVPHARTARALSALLRAKLIAKKEVLSSDGNWAYQSLKIM